LVGEMKNINVSCEKPCLFCPFCYDGYLVKDEFMPVLRCVACFKEFKL
jgi:hypothetical protein